MSDAECIARKWGSSLGLVIPKNIVEEENLTENEKLIVSIRKKRVAKEFFGLLAGWNKPTAEIKKEMKKGWD